MIVLILMIMSIESSYIILSKYNKIIYNESKYNYYNVDPSVTKCQKDTDCRMNWCSSKNICVKETVLSSPFFLVELDKEEYGICLSLLDYPCLRTEYCNPIKKKCYPKPCFTKFQCDDGFFCNGFEYCDPIKMICINNSTYPCDNICDEDNKICIANIKKEEKEGDNSGVIEKSDIKTMGSDSLWDSNSKSIQIIFLVIIIVMFIAIVFLCFLYSCTLYTSSRKNLLFHIL